MSLPAVDLSLVGRDPQVRALISALQRAASDGQAAKTLAFKLIHRQEAKQSPDRLESLLQRRYGLSVDDVLNALPRRETAAAADRR